MVSLIVVLVLGSTATFIYRVIRTQIDKAATAARDYQIAINKEATMAILAVTAWKALPAVNMILSSIATVRNALPYISSQIRYFGLIESDMGKRQNTTSPESAPVAFKDRIRFNHVSFAYQGMDTPVLHDLYLKCVFCP
jgi:ABC-type multidrug transport system fused ATPase/permease subunit